MPRKVTKHRKQDGTGANRPHPGPPLGLILGLVVLSGFAALVYEILWFRQLGLVFGNTVQAAATVLAAFMLGLAWGAHRARRWAVRSLNPLKLFAALEAGIGLYALAVPLLMSLLQSIYQAAAQTVPEAQAALTALRFVLALLLLLAPTMLMGASLPVLSEVVLRNPDRFGSRLGWLYGCNTLGATLGVVVSGFILVPALGMESSNRLAAAVNLGVGGVAWLLGRSLRHQAPSMPRATAGEPTPAAFATRPVGLLAAAALCGLLALAAETLWFRALVLVFGATTYSFTVMVAVFLVGISLGSASLGWLANRSQRAAWALAGSLAAGGLWTLLSVRLYDATPELLLRMLVRSEFTWNSMLVAKVLLAAFFLLPLAVVSGLAFTALARLARDRAHSPGPALSAVFSVNSLGSAVGAVLAGFALLPVLGLEKSLLVLAALSILAGLAAAWLAPGRIGLRLGFAVALVAAAAALRLGVDPWDPLVLSSGGYFNPQTHVRGNQITLREGLRSIELLHYKEGKTATVAVTRTPGGRLHYSSQGKVEADTSEPGMSLQRLQGHLPMLLHPKPRRVLNIGLGAGVTAGALATYPDAAIDVVDIEPAATGVASVWADFNHDVVRQGRCRIIANDGRNHLLVTQTRYDVITSDPFEPVVAGAASLYTVEHFQLARSRLAPGGMVAQFLPLYELSSDDVLIIMRSFLKVFPRSVIFLTGVETVLVGLDDQARIDFSNVTAKFDLPEVRDSLAGIGIDRPERVLELMVADLTRENLQFLEGVTHTDDRPVIEFSAPKHALSYRVDQNLRVVLAHCQPVPEVHLARLEPAGAEAVRQASQGLRVMLEGCIRRSTGDLRESLELIREAARLAPSNPVVRAELTQTLILLGDQETAAGRIPEAAALYSEVLKADPKEFWALYNLARILGPSNPAQAQEHLRQGLAAWPEEPYLLALRAGWRAGEGDTTGACADLHSVLKRLPLRGDLWETYAACLRKAGRDADAVRAEERARAARAW